MLIDLIGWDHVKKLFVSMKWLKCEYICIKRNSWEYNMDTKHEKTKNK